jgi:hypothetical protein
MPFPVDDFPASAAEAAALFAPFGLEVDRLVDEDDLYVLVLRRA